MLPECVNFRRFSAGQVALTLFSASLSGGRCARSHSQTWTHIPVIPEAAETQAALFLTRDALSPAVFAEPRAQGGTRVGRGEDLGFSRLRNGAKRQPRAQRWGYMSERCAADSRSLPRPRFWAGRS